jgi:hypothetical protein
MLAFGALFRITARVQTDPGRGLNGRRQKPQGQRTARLPVFPLPKYDPEPFRGFGEA